MLKAPNLAWSIIALPGVAESLGLQVPSLHLPRETNITCWSQWITQAAACSHSRD